MLMNPIRHWLYAVMLLAATAHAEQSFTLEQAIARAHEIDPWISGSLHREQSFNALGEAEANLPDPTISLGIANLPIDSLDFNQEAMTQLKVGVSQMLPRGDSLALRQQRYREIGAQQPFLRADRDAQVRLTVSRLWLDAWRAEQTIALIRRDRSLFEYLVDVAESSYTSAAGRTRQQDLIRAQLELTRLDDRLTRLELERDARLAQLGEWLGEDAIPAAAAPEITPTIAPATLGSAQQLGQQLTNHPRVRAIDQQLLAAQTEVELARQDYKPQWGLNAGYGYRDEDAFGRHRDDFLSFGVSVSMPLFDTDKQDNRVLAARSSTEALRTDRALILRSLRAGFETARRRLARLDERLTLYRDRLLEELHDQSEASLAAYTNDTGDFAEVVRARIAELNAHIDVLYLEATRLQTIAEINYHLATSETGAEQS